MIVFIGWSAFLAENIILSHNKDYIVKRYGQDGYHTLYNTLSTVACSSILYGFFKNRGKGILNPLFSRSLIPLVIQAVGFAGLMQSLPKFQIPVSINLSTFHPKMLCPIDFKDKGAKDADYGMQRITRHPSLWSLGLAGLGTALSRKHLSDAVFFGFPLIIAAVGGWHSDYLHYKDNDYYRSTSLMPFVALVNGKQKWSDLKDEIKWVNVGIAVGVSLLLRK
jgi:uncharacterized membrane protein